MKIFADTFSPSEDKYALRKKPLNDRGGRRLFSDRRGFSYGIYYPNRRFRNSVIISVDHDSNKFRKIVFPNI